MGCDIHLFVEYRGRPIEADPAPRWWAFGKEFHLGRHYEMFGALAGVRDPRQQHIEPRGVPADIGWTVQDRYWLRVNEELREAGCEGYTTPAAAADYVRGGSVWDADKRKVSHPDWHSHTWLTMEEYAAALARVPEHDVEYDAVLAILGVYSQRGYEVRLVFWFDN